MPLFLPRSKTHDQKVLPRVKTLSGTQRRHASRKISRQRFAASRLERRRENVVICRCFSERRSKEGRATERPGASENGAKHFLRLNDILILVARTSLYISIHSFFCSRGLALPIMVFKVWASATKWIRSIGQCEKVVRDFFRRSQVIYRHFSAKYTF